MGHQGIHFIPKHGLQNMWNFKAKEINLKSQFYALLKKNNTSIQGNGELKEKKMKRNSHNPKKKYEQNFKKLKEFKESKWDIKVCALLQNMGLETWGTLKPNNEISNFARNVYFIVYFLDKAFGVLDLSLWAFFLPTAPRDYFCTLVPFLLATSGLLTI